MMAIMRRIGLIFFVCLIVSNMALAQTAKPYAALVSNFSGNLECVTITKEHFSITVLSEIPPGSSIVVKAGSPASAASIEIMTPLGFNYYSSFPVKLGQTVFTPVAGDRKKKDIAGIAIRRSSKGLDPIFEWSLAAFNISASELAAGFSLVLSPTADSLSRTASSPFTFRLAKGLSVKSVSWSISPNPTNGTADSQGLARKESGEWILDFKPMGLMAGYRYVIRVVLATESGKVMETLLTVGVIPDDYIKSMVTTMETEYKDDPKFIRDMDIAAAYKDNQLYSAYFRAMAELGYRLEGLRE